MNEKNGMKTGIFYLTLFQIFCSLIFMIWFCSGGYNVLNDRIYINGNRKNNNTNTTVKSISSFPKSTTTSNVTSLLDLLEDKEIVTDFKDIKKTNNGNNYMLSCETYNSNLKICSQVKAILSGYINIREDFTQSLSSLSNKTEAAALDAFKTEKANKNTLIYTTDRYYVIYNHQLDGSNSISIYDSEGIVYKNTDVKIEYTVNSVKYNTVPVISNNLLHFVEAVSSGGLRYLTIDLSTSDLDTKTVEEFEATY